jgi:4-diphosphocytidyl-2-C-methyl-D-erythritol kinase
MGAPDIASTDTVTLATGCKVNLHLRLTGRRADGYHTLESLFVPLAAPGDRLTLTFGPQGGPFSLAAGDPALEGPGNTVARAWRAFGAATGFAPGLAVRLDKGVPMGAGLGGGSADAAAVLRALNERAGPRALGEAALARLGAAVGADVPFFLGRGPAWAEGIGEALTPVDAPLAGLTLVLLCPEVHVSTAWAYAAWDAAHPEAASAPRPSGPQAHHSSLTWTKERFKSSPCSLPPLYNSFEEVVFPAHPILREYKEELLRSGACGAVMSGSGASLLGLFRDALRAGRCVRGFQAAAVRAFVHHF